MPQVTVDVKPRRIYVVAPNGGLAAYATTYSTERNKTPVWIYSPPGVKFSPSAPTVAKKSIIVGKEGDLYLGGADGHLYVVEPDNAEESRHISADIPVSNVALVTCPVVDSKNDILYVVDANHTLFALDLRYNNPYSEGNDTKFRILWYADDVMGAPALSPFDRSIVVSGANHTVKAYIGGR